MFFLTGSFTTRINQWYHHHGETDTIASIIFLSASIFFFCCILISINNGYSAEGVKTHWELLWHRNSNEVENSKSSSRRQTHWELLWHNSIPLFCLLEHHQQCWSSPTALNLAHHGQNFDPWCLCIFFVQSYSCFFLHLIHRHYVLFRQHVLFPVVSSGAFQETPICSLWLICPWALLPLLTQLP